MEKPKILYHQDHNTFKVYVVLVKIGFNTSNTEFKFKIKKPYLSPWIFKVFKNSGKSFELCSKVTIKLSL